LEGLDLTIPEEKTLLDKVLSKLPSDQDWNENIPREAALKEQGESRYLYQANLMVERKLETKEENKLVGNLDSTDKKALAAFNDKEASASACGCFFERENSNPASWQGQA